MPGSFLGSFHLIKPLICPLVQFLERNFSFLCKGNTHGNRNSNCFSLILVGNMKLFGKQFHSFLQYIQRNIPEEDNELITAKSADHILWLKVKKRITRSSRRYCVSSVLTSEPSPVNSTRK